MRRKRQMTGPGVIAALAMSACLLVQTGAAVRARAAAGSPQPIAGGTFEASGVAYVPGTTGVLFVDDGRHREIFWMEIGANGGQRAPAGSRPPAPPHTCPGGNTADRHRFL